MEGGHIPIWGLYENRYFSISEDFKFENSNLVIVTSTDSMHPNPDMCIFPVWGVAEKFKSLPKSGTSPPPNP